MEYETIAKQKGTPFQFFLHYDFPVPFFGFVGLTFEFFLMPPKGPPLIFLMFLQLNGC